jgi:hypothetical protein
MPLTLILYRFVFAALLSLVPASRRHALPGWDEDDAAYEARVAYIASAIANVARNRREAAAMVAAAVHESGLARDVYEGRCYRVGSWAARCDGGRAVGVYQLQGFDGRGLLAETREAHRRIVASWWRCRDLEPALRWSAYASGSCAQTGRAAEASREIDALMRKAER